MLATRLSEDPDVRVLLLEAGPANRSWRIDMPAGMAGLLSSERFNWAYVSEPEPFLDNRRLSHPRGRVLGGSSSINGMMYVRGHARDYDGWAQRGCRGWSYAEVLPYFRRAEHHQKGGSAYHGGEGPLFVSSPANDASPLAGAFIQAGQQAGYPYTARCQWRSSRRASGRWTGRPATAGAGASRAAIWPARQARPNLTIVTGALAHAIRFEGRRAVGVDYVRAGQAETARAEREVILCGGAFNSPQLLQLSGIGPADHLAKLGIAVRHDLPGVGANLNDHPDIVVQHLCRQPVSIYPATRAPRKFLVGLQWFLTAAGWPRPITSRPAPSSAAGPASSIPICSSPSCRWPSSPARWRACPAMPSRCISISCGRGAWAASCCAAPIPRTRRRSVSTIMADPADRADMRQGVKLLREVLAQKALDPYRGAEIFPGPEIRSDDEIDAWIRQAIETCYHPVGTCRMGCGLEGGAVVDDQLRVHGLEGLRVVDASVMPAIVSGNTNAPTIMIAEKASDMIRGREALRAADLPVWIHPGWEAAQR